MYPLVQEHWLRHWCQHQCQIALKHEAVTGQLLLSLVQPSNAMDTILGCVSNPWEFMRCHSDHFRPCMTHIDIYRCFYSISDVCLLLSDLLLHRQTIYAFSI